MSDGLSAVTEAINAATHDLDLLATADLVALLGREQRAAAEAVERATPQIARAVDAISARLRDGGSLHYVGAGTSGRLATLDAAECPPTFGTPAKLVVAHVAGGASALVRAIEGAEDDAAAGAAAVAALAPCDVAACISASGRAPFVVAAQRAARARGALTIAVTSDADSPLAREAEIAIAVATGPEPLAGSTRLKAGTAQKLVLNALSTATMVRLGKVYDNVMIDVVATNAKLRVRARLLVESLATVDAAEAERLLRAADGSAKVAVAMARLGIDAPAARAALAGVGGFLRPLMSPRA